MEKRVTFKGWTLPLLLLFPQLLVTLVFFFWPAGQAIYQSAFIPDPFGLKTQFVGFDNFLFLFTDPLYLASFKTTAVFSGLVTLLSMALALWLAVRMPAVRRGLRAMRVDVLARLERLIEEVLPRGLEAGGENSPALHGRRGSRGVPE